VIVLAPARRGTEDELAPGSFELLGASRPAEVSRFLIQVQACETSFKVAADET